MKNILKLCLGFIMLIISCKKNESETNQKSEVKKIESKISDGQNKNNDVNFRQSENFLKDYANPKSYNSLSLLELIRIKKLKNNETDFFTIINEFPTNWVKYEELEKLINLIDSKEKCKCLLNPLSSNIPTKEQGSIGGYTVLLIKSFKNKTKIDIGLYYCPKTSEKEIIEIKKWWKQLSASKKPNG